MISAPIESSEDWKGFLADPERQWKKGYSAYTIAHMWQNADGFPEEIQQLFDKTDAISTQEPLLIIPETRIPMSKNRN